MKVSTTDIHKPKNRLAVNSRNNHPQNTSQYIGDTMHPKIRKNNTSTPRIYTVDNFPICHHIHHQPSPSMTVH